MLLLTLIAVIVAIVVVVLTKPLVVEQQRAFFERADLSSDNITLTVNQVGSKRFFNCLDVCNYVNVRLSTDRLSIDELNQSLDILFAEKYERKYSLVGNVFYNPEVERNCTLIKRIKDINHSDTCDGVKPFWEMKGIIAYGPVGDTLPECEVLMVNFSADEFTDINQAPINSTYHGEAKCKKGGLIDKYNEAKYLEPLSCVNFKVCHDEELKVRSD